MSQIIKIYFTLTGKCLVTSWENIKSLGDYQMIGCVCVCVCVFFFFSIGRGNNLIHEIRWLLDAMYLVACLELVSN